MRLLENFNRLNETLKEFDTLKRPDDLEALLNRGKKVLEELSR